MGLPSGPCGSTIAGILLFGLIARKSGLNWSPAAMSTGIARYGRPHSSSMMWTLWPFGVAHEYTSIMAGGPRGGWGRTIQHHAGSSATMVDRGRRAPRVAGVRGLGPRTRLDAQAHHRARRLGHGPQR